MTHNLATSANVGSVVEHSVQQEFCLEMEINVWKQQLMSGNINDLSFTEASPRKYKTVYTRNTGRNKLGTNIVIGFQIICRFSPGIIRGWLSASSRLSRHGSHGAARSGSRCDSVPASAARPRADSPKPAAACPAVSAVPATPRRGRSAPPRARCSSDPARRPQASARPSRRTRAASLSAPSGPLPAADRAPLK